jgi:hypothetical protein
MIQCSKCGTQLPDSMETCSNCGTPVSSVTVPQAPKEKQSQTAKTMGGVIGAAAMVMVMVGSALHWTTVSVGPYSVSKGGLSGDGVFTIGLAALGFLLFILATFLKARLLFIAAWILSILILGIAVYDTISIVRDARGFASLGIGLILCLIGGVIGFIAGAYSIR